MDQLKDALQNAVRKTADFEKLKRPYRDDRSPAEGLRIELMESEAGTFFGSGAAVPTEGAKDILAALADELGKLPNRISIEGHTDAKPFAADGAYGNWELSSDRANAARRLMEQSGLQAGPGHRRCAASPTGICGNRRPRRTPPIAGSRSSCNIRSIRMPRRRQRPSQRAANKRPRRRRRKIRPRRRKSTKLDHQPKVLHASRVTIVILHNDPLLAPPDPILHELQ